jgi:16S rRNA (adenine1518-N6/adenine1519-N6)-dimethyltransferase
LNKSTLLDFLNEIGATPRKELSQNFLINSSAISQIVDLAELTPGDWVLEIGAGAGAITQELLARGAHVLAIEKDRNFAHHLERMQTEDQRLQIRCCDFLQFPLDTLLALSSTWKVVSNLPYQITAPILEILCDHASLFTSATLVVQKEVGDRICAKPHSKIMGSLTIFLQFYTEFAGSFPLSASCFYPKPAVESMALRLDFKPSKSPIDPLLFFPIVRKAYQQRRKMLTTSLKTVCPTLGAILITLGLSPKARPEELALEDWIALVKEIS